VNPAELKANVDTIVIVMMENRSFDNVLGFLKGARPEVEGIADVADPAYLNPNGDGVGVPPFWMKDAPLPSDQPHDKDAVQTQMAFSPITGSYAMNGFVKAYEDEFHTSIDQPPVMGLLTPADLPTTAALADRYTVCDHWFACVPTSTAPNRLMSMCGYTNIDETQKLVPNQDTVYHWLTRHSVRWRVYSAGLPFLMLMPDVALLTLTSHFRRLDELPKDLAESSPETSPQVIFIEPDYYDSPIHFRAPCDNHAPLPVAPGEAFLAEVYGWLTKDPARWARTVLIVTYDEHGGFFDHFPPQPVKYRNPNGVKFDSTGPRVPTIVAGPFAPRTVSKAILDNTSILQLLAERFGSAGEPYSAEVTGRALQKIASASTVLDANAANLQIAKPGPAPMIKAMTSAPHGSSELRNMFGGAVKTFLEQHYAEALEKYPELQGFTAG
jgi:phospholipase C